MTTQTAVTDKPSSWRNPPPVSQRCQAKSKRTGKPCGQWAMKGRKHCYHHGGPSLVGPANPAWKNGTHSELLKQGTRQKQAYEDALNNIDFLSLREDAALIHGRIADLLEKQTKAQANALPILRQARDLAKDIQFATVQKDNVAFNEGVSALVGLLTKAKAPDHWPKISKQIDRLARLKTGEHGRILDLELLWRMDEVKTMVLAHSADIVAALDKYVTNRKEAQKVKIAGSESLKKIFLDSGDDSGGG